MSNIDKRALREAAERAESDSWGYDRDEFNEALTPSTVLALLDELEAKDAQIANLTAERDALREGEMGDAKHSNTRAAADIYFQLVEECEVPAGGSLIEYVSELRERAAMIQGAEQPQSAQQNIPENIPTLKYAVIAVRNSGIAIDGEIILAERDALNSPDCGCRTCRPVTISDMRFVVCPECGNKRCPHANDHMNACTGSNEPGQEGSAYPAALQQEVK